MNNDQRYAIALGLISTSLLWKVIRYPVLEVMAHSVSIVLAGVLVFYLATLGYVVTSTVIVMVVIYLMREWSEYTTTPERKVYLDGVEADARFNVAHSVDLQWATKIAKHDAPQMLHPPIAPTEPLLTYPPSADTLFEMNG